MTVAVIPYGAMRRPTLPYAARALEANTPTDRLIVVGAEPKGITPDDYWESSNSGKPHECTNRHLRLAAERLQAEGVTEFVWTADDTFPMSWWEPVCHVRTYSIAKHLADFPRLAGYSELIRDSIAIMEADGYDPSEVPCGAIHRPMLVQCDRVLATLDRLAPGGHFKSLYVAGLDGVVPAGDAKVKNNVQPRVDVDCLSTDPSSWGRQAGKFIRARLSDPSRWEVSARMPVAMREHA